KQYENYKRCMWKHHKRFGLLDSKIQFRENIINYVMNHLKNNSYVNPVDGLRASSYKHAEKLNCYNE
ncbi:hypothetical protein AB4653_28810, partial [Vibrio sp. 10N.222.48.A3]